MKNPISWMALAISLVQPLFWGPTAVQLLQWRPPNYTTQNGAWTCITAIPNPSDSRRDDIVACGWNLNNEAVGAGETGIHFESHCDATVGCSGTQSETYFSMSDGNGNSVRPLGFFQSHQINFMNVIARADEWGFFDAPQEKALLILRSNRDHALYGTLSCEIPGNCLQQQGVDMIKFDGTAIRVGGTGAGVSLAGGDGSSPVKVLSNHFQLQNPVIENTSGITIANFGSALTITCAGGVIITDVDHGLVTAGHC